MKDRIIKDILREYDDLRLQHKETVIQRENEVFSAIPEMKILHDQLIDLMGDATRDIIEDPAKVNTAIPYLQDRVYTLKQREEELLLEHGFPPDYLQPKYRCPICKDTGFVGDLVKDRCKCLTQRILIDTYQLSDMLDLETQNFDTFDADIFPDTALEGRNISQREYMLSLRDMLIRYVEVFPENDKKNILFTGKTGLGKTFLLNCLAKSILDKGYTVLRITAYKLFDRLFFSSLKDQNENMQLLSYIFDVDVLIIDDLGTETRRNNYTQEDLFNILNDRMLSQKHTFLSTNLSLTDIQDRYSDRIASRLFDTSNTMLIKFVGQDLRTLKKGRHIS